MTNTVEPERDLNKIWGMDRERYNELMKNPAATLTEQEIAAGWHFCNDWDGLLIHRSSPEYLVCTCYKT